MSKTVVRQLVTANSNKTFRVSFLPLFGVRLPSLRAPPDRYVRDLSTHSPAKNTTTEKLAPPTTGQRRSSTAPPTSSDPRAPLASYADLFPSHRSKRQAFGSEQLCKSTYQYITPQAALNSQGMCWTTCIHPMTTMMCTFRVHLG